jgi:hypothetical protein
MKGMKPEVSSEGVREGKRVAVLGKKRCLAAETLEGVMPPFVLSVKKEAPREVEMEKEQNFSVVGKGRGLRVKALDTPNWLEVEVGEMEAVVKRSETLVQDLSTKLEEEAIQKGRLEGEVRRVKMRMSDRMVMLKEAELEVAKLLGEESKLNSLILRRKPCCHEVRVEKP